MDGYSRKSEGGIACLFLEYLSLLNLFPVFLWPLGALFSLFLKTKMASLLKRCFSWFLFDVMATRGHFFFTFF